MQLFAAKCEQDYVSSKHLQNGMNMQLYAASMFWNKNIFPANYGKPKLKINLYQTSKLSSILDWIQQWQ